MSYVCVTIFQRAEVDGADHRAALVMPRIDSERALTGLGATDDELVSLSHTNNSTATPREAAVAIASNKRDIRHEPGAVSRTSSAGRDAQAR